LHVQIDPDGAPLLAHHLADGAVVDERDRSAVHEGDPPFPIAAQAIARRVATGKADAIEQAIRLSEEKDCSVGAMVQKTASFHTTFEIVTEKREWANQAEPAVTQA